MTEGGSNGKLYAVIVRDYSLALRILRDRRTRDGFVALVLFLVADPPRARGLSQRGAEVYKLEEAILSLALRIARV